MKTFLESKFPDLRTFLGSVLHYFRYYIYRAYSICVQTHTKVKTSFLGQRIVLTFTDIRIECDCSGCTQGCTAKCEKMSACSSCPNDHVLVYDGDSSNAPLLMRICGYSLVPPITSTGSNLLVIFRSDLSSSSKGFNSTYLSIIKPMF